MSLASCNRQSKIYNLKLFFGVLAQLVERLNGIEEVRGSNPLGSIFREISRLANVAVEYLPRIEPLPN